MKRIVKKPDVRRAEILLAAETLFEKKGYTKTPVEAIINKAGIAKGTFYHYFKTKQDVLKAIIDNISVELKRYYISIIEDNTLDATKKLKLIIKGQEKKTKIKPTMMEALHIPENRELQERLNIISVKTIAPLIAKVFEQGFQEGDFKKSVSVETIQLIIAASQFVLDSGLFVWPSRKRLEFLKSLQNMTELAAGVKLGTFSFISKE